MSIDFSDVDLILGELRHVEQAFEKLDDPAVFDYYYTRRCVNPSQDKWFQAQKQRYKKARDDAWRWLKNHGFKPTERRDYEKGFYDELGFFPARADDNPIQWQRQTLQVMEELKSAAEWEKRNLSEATVYLQV